LNKQLILGQATVTIRHRLCQGIGNPRSCSDHRRPRDPEPLGDKIRRFEANARDVAGQPIRIFGDQRDGIGSIGLEYAYRT
jgi:hypothetical protein